MKRQQIIITVVAILGVISLYQLPKVVVDNDESSSLAGADNSSEVEIHSIDVPDSILILRDELRGLFLTSNSKEKSFIFADSLARSFLVYNELDSATRYANELESLADGPEMIEKVGDFYYSAFSFGNGSVSQQFAEKTREYYQQIIESESRPGLEMRVAMTLVSGPNPMEGILKLRELANQYPENLEGQYNLGLLSLRSGQYDRAVQRFTNVLEIDPDNLEGHLYLGVSYLEKGERDKAKEYFDYVAEKGKDPAIKRLVEEYLNEIN